MFAEISIKATISLTVWNFYEIQSVVSMLLVVLTVWHEVTLNSLTPNCIALHQKAITRTTRVVYNISQCTCESVRKCTCKCARCTCNQPPPSSTYHFSSSTVSVLCAGKVQGCTLMRRINWSYEGGIELCGGGVGGSGALRGCSSSRGLVEITLKYF